MTSSSGNSSDDRNKKRFSASSFLTKSRGCYGYLSCLVVLILCWSQWELLNVSTSQGINIMSTSQVIASSDIDPQGCDESASSTQAGENAARTSSAMNNSKNSSSTSSVVQQPHYHHRRKDVKDLGTWIGDQWVPPKGWKLYNPVEMQELLKDESVLFLGDSLARRLMTTFYEILNHTTKHPATMRTTTNSTKTGGDNNHHHDRHIPRAPLEDPDIIDRNKMSTRNFTDVCEKWKDHPVLSTAYGHWLKYAEASICRYIPSTPPEEQRYWDYAPVTCYRELSEMIRLNAATNYSISKAYSIIIIAMGAWEGHPDKLQTCSIDSEDHKEYPLNIYRGLQHTLDKLPLLTFPRTDDDDTTNNSRRTVLWRINGYHHEMLNEEVHERQYDMIREHFEKMGEEYEERNIYMLDWAKIIMPRSMNESRIVGDIKVHYGLDARLQLIQMMLNFLVEKQALPSL